MLFELKATFMIIIALVQVRANEKKLLSCIPPSEANGFRISILFASLDLMTFALTIV